MATKKSDTWMPFYVTDYLGDTMHLSTTQHGAYLLLLLACWKAGGALPDEEDQLAAITRMQPAEWRKHAKVLRRFFQEQDGQLLHGRVKKELDRAAALSSKRSEAGKTGGRPPKGKQKESNSFSDAEAKGEQSETPSPSPTPSPSEISEPIGSDAALQAASVDNSNPKTEEEPDQEGKAECWRRAVKVLAAGGCESAKDARTFMGKLVQEWTFPIVRQAVEAAAVAQPAEGMSYLTATCKKLHDEANGSAAAARAAEDAAAETQAYLAQQAAHAAVPPPANLRKVHG